MTATPDRADCTPTLAEAAPPVAGAGVLVPPPSLPHRRQLSQRQLRLPGQVGLDDRGSSLDDQVR
jgi:hypothetical protein